MSKFGWELKGIGGARQRAGLRENAGSVYGQRSRGRGHAVATPSPASLGPDEGYEHIEGFPRFGTRIRAGGTVMRLMDALERCGVRVFVSPASLDRVDLTVDRLGLTAQHSVRAPLIWVNVARHGYASGGRPNETELIDTLAHEAVHAMCGLLGIKLPGVTSPLQDQALGEVSAHRGCSVILDELGETAQAARNRATVLMGADVISNAAAVVRALSDGDRAAEYFIQTGGLRA